MRKEIPLSNVTIILSEETFGPHRTPELGIVFLANLPWLLFPLAILYRMGRNPTPFTRPTSTMVEESPPEMAG